MILMVSIRGVVTVHIQQERRLVTEKETPRILLMRRTQIIHFRFLLQKPYGERRLMGTLTGFFPARKNSILCMSI